MAALRTFMESESRVGSPNSKEQNEGPTLTASLLEAVFYSSAATGKSSPLDLLAQTNSVQTSNHELMQTTKGVSAPISKALSVSLVIQDTYKSVPASGKLKNDFKLIAGLSYNF